MTGEQSDPPKLPPEAVAALAGGNKVVAIKIVRESQKVDLKTAKDVVESYIELHPEMHLQFASRSKQSRQGWIFWLLVAALLVWVAMTYIAKF
jgi:hypothetical protein